MATSTNTPARRRQADQAEPTAPDTDLFGRPAGRNRKKNPPPVTKAQWTFAYLHVYGHTIERAYAEAYPRAAKHKSRSTITRRARKLLELPQVADQVEKLRHEIRYHEGYTPEQHMNQLADLRDMAVDKGDIKAAVQAEVNRGKAAGFYIERHEHTHHRPTDPAEIMQRIATIAEKRPEVLQMLAEKNPRMLEALLQRTGQVAELAAAPAPVPEPAAPTEPDPASESPSDHVKTSG